MAEFGRGLFFSYIANNTLYRWHFGNLAGSQQDISSRIGVNKLSETANIYRIVYLNRDSEDRLGIYATDINVETADAPLVRSPQNSSFNKGSRSAAWAARCSI